MEIIYFIAKTLAAIVCVSSALLLLYLSIKARAFLVSLKELEDLLNNDIRKIMLKGSMALNAILPLIFKPGKSRSPFELIAYIIDMVKTRCKS